MICIEFADIFHKNFLQQMPLTVNPTYYMHFRAIPDIDGGSGVDVCADSAPISYACSPCSITLTIWQIV